MKETRSNKKDKTEHVRVKCPGSQGYGLIRWKMWLIVLKLTFR